MIALAATVVANEDRARFMMGSAQMLAHHHAASAGGCTRVRRPPAGTDAALMAVTAAPARAAELAFDVSRDETLLVRLSGAWTTDDLLGL